MGFAFDIATRWSEYFQYVQNRFFFGMHAFERIYFHREPQACSQLELY